MKNEDRQNLEKMVEALRYHAERIDSHAHIINARLNLEAYLRENPPIADERPEKAES